MPSLIDTLTGTGDTAKMSGAVIASDLILGAKVASGAYLAAALEASTPEVKSLFMNNVTMNVQTHQTLVELSLKKGWLKPYQTPVEQLREAFSYSQKFTRPDA